LYFISIVQYFKNRIRYCRVVSI